MTQRNQQAKHIMKLIEDGGCEDEINNRLYCLLRNVDFPWGVGDWKVCPKYTTSLDALLDIVPEGWAMNLWNGDFNECYLTKFKEGKAVRCLNHETRTTIHAALLHCIMQIIAEGYDE